MTVPSGSLSCAQTIYDVRCAHKRRGPRMLVKEQNDLLTADRSRHADGADVPVVLDPGVARLSVSDRDGPPVRVHLLSENLIAFRDTEGRLGLIEEFCAHRRVSLWFGRNGGERAALPLSRLEIRRDRPVRGNPLRARRAARIASASGWGTIRSSSAAKSCGPIWGRPTASRNCRNGNSRWCRTISASSPSAGRMQLAPGFEGRIDTSHVSFLHRGDLETDPIFKGSKGNQYNLDDLMPVFNVVGKSGRALYRGAAQRRGRQVLLAHHAMGDAGVHK